MAVVITTKTPWRCAHCTLWNTYDAYLCTRCGEFDSALPPPNNASDSKIVWESQSPIKAETFPPTPCDTPSSPLSSSLSLVPSSFKAESKEEVSPPRPPIPKRVFKRKKHNADGNVIDPQTLETAMEHATRLTLDGCMKPRVPQCPTCGEKGCTEEDRSSGCFVCTSCGLVLGAVYDDGLPQRHERVTVEADDRVHSMPGEFKDDYTVRTNEDGTKTLIHRRVEVLSTSVRSTKMSGGTDALTLAQVSSHARGMKTKQRKRDSACHPAMSAIERVIVDVDTLMRGLALDSNMPLRRRVIDIATRYIHTRKDADRPLKSTGCVASAVLIYACAEVQIGIRRDDIVRMAPGRRFFGCLSKWSQRVIDTCDLPSIDRGHVIMGFLHTYMGKIRDITPIERMKMIGMVVWVRCMLETVRRLPAPLPDGRPYTHTETPMEPTARGHINKPTGARIVGRLLPGRTKMSRVKRPPVASHYQWVSQITETAIQIYGESDDKQDVFWVSKIKPSIVDLLIDKQLGITKPLIIAKPSDEWHIRRFAPFTIAATIIWLVAQMRAPAPSALRGATAAADGSAGIKRKRSIKTPGVSVDTPHHQCAAIRRIHHNTKGLTRITQDEIRQATNISIAPMKYCKRALHAVWRIIM